MSELRKDLNLEGQIALIEQTVSTGFSSINEKLDKLVSQDDLRLAIKDRDSKIDHLEQKIDSQVSDLQKEIGDVSRVANRPLRGVTVITAVISVIVTFLLTYFLEDVISK